MKIESFEDIIAWQKAKELSVAVYESFRGSKDFGFRDQIQRAAVSIMNNISEGFERHTDKEFRHSLFIAKGSCAEVRSMLYLALDLNVIDHDQFDTLYQNTLEISKILSGLIKALNQKTNTTSFS